MGKFKDNSMAAIVWDVNSITVGALVAATSVTVAIKIDALRLNGFRLLKTEYYLKMVGATTGESPLLFGIEHDLTAAEVAQTISADPQRPNDPESSARAMQPVWPMAVLAANADGDGKIWAEGVITIGWSAQEGTQFSWFVHNFGTINLTSGSFIRVIAKHFGVWLRD